MPSVYTKPLSEDYVSDGPKLIEAVRLAWQSTEQDEFILDPWQEDLINRVLERYPDDWPDERLRGQLRYKEVVISMGRQ